MFLVYIDMFKYCVWYVFNNKFNSIIRRNATLFGTQSFPAHITIASGLTLPQARLVAKRYQDMKPQFVAYGSAIQTHARVPFEMTYTDFFAIEQRLKVNGIESDVHVSLAYKDTPFSSMDIAVANMGIPSHIDSRDLRVCVADCRLLPNRWTIMAC